MSDTPDRGPANGLTGKGLPASPTASDAYPVGTRLQHHAGSEWEVVEWIGGHHEDRRIRCVEGTERPGFKGGEKVGSEIVVHDEYVPRSFRVVPLSAEAPAAGAPSTKAGSGAGGEPSHRALLAALAACGDGEANAFTAAVTSNRMLHILRAAYAVDGRAGDGD